LLVFSTLNAPQKNCVIPTEAAHGFIVSGAAEGPPHFASVFVVAVAFVFAVAVTFVFAVAVTFAIACSSNP
jgi:hypothetical protein